MVMMVITLIVIVGIIHLLKIVIKDIKNDPVTNLVIPATTSALIYTIMSLLSRTQ